MGMSVKLAGAGTYGDVEAQVDPSHRALRASLRPIEVGPYGSYALALASAVITSGMAANAVIYGWRWSTPAVICRVTKLRITAGADATAFVPGSTLFSMQRAQNYASQYTGGANLNLAGVDQARASRFVPSQQANITNSATGNVAIAAGSGGLTIPASGVVLDNNPVHMLIGSVSASGMASLVPAPGLLVDPTEASRQPMEFVNGQGFVVRATVPGTGTWRFGIEIEWDELDQMRYLGLYT